MKTDPDVQSARNLKGADTKKHKALLQKKFLEAYRESGFILQTCQRVSVLRGTVLDWLAKDPVFEREFDAANEEVTEKCEVAALHRAVIGYLDPIYHQGKKVGDRRLYSDRLLELILKARNRKKYSDHIEHEIDERVAETLAHKMIAALRKVMPDVCPGCKTKLGFGNKIAEEMLALSAKVAA